MLSKIVLSAFLYKTSLLVEFGSHLKKYSVKLSFKDLLGAVDLNIKSRKPLIRGNLLR
jgi:hypothetical protein